MIAGRFVSWNRLGFLLQMVCFLANIKFYGLQSQKREEKLFVQDTLPSEWSLGVQGIFFQT